MKKIKLEIQYDGTDFCGWQKQPQGKSIQGCMEDALCKVFGKEISIFGSGRTDAGVHAIAQSAHFEVETKMSEHNIVKALNSNLPCSIRVLSATEVNSSFDARKSAIKKTYIYLFYLSNDSLPLFDNRALCVSPNINFDAMKKSLKFLEGTHNFKSFCASKSGRNNFVRTIFDCSFEKYDNNIWAFEISGNGFLYNMVRVIFGTLLEIGEGKRMPQDLKDIINAENRTRAGKTAKAFGLYLKAVEYN